MQQGTQLFDGLIAAIRPSAIGEQGDGEATLGIAPERSSGVAQMPEGARGKPGSGLRWLRGRIPSRAPAKFREGSLCRAVKSSTVSGWKSGWPERRP